MKSPNINPIYLPKVPSYKTYLGYGYGLSFFPNVMPDGKAEVTLGFLKEVAFACPKPSILLSDEEKRIMRIINYLLISKPTFLLNFLKNPKVSFIRNKIWLHSVENVCDETGTGDTIQEAVDSAWKKIQPKIDSDRQLRKTHRTIWEIYQLT
jgi:hypothetical protein